MALIAQRLKQEVSSWPGISVLPHRFVAWEYRFGKAEVGHVHFWGDLDIPFPGPFMPSSSTTVSPNDTTGFRPPAGQLSISAATSASSTQLG